jgi:predicted PurR-regulated permease PerM
MAYQERRLPTAAAALLGTFAIHVVEEIFANRVRGTARMGTGAMWPRCRGAPYALAERNLVATQHAPTAPRPMSEAQFIRRVFVVVGILALVAALYLLSDLLLLVFGAVLVAVTLRAIATPIARETSLGQRFSLLAAGLGVLALLGGIAYVFGAQISDQLVALFDKLPAAADAASQRVPFLAMPVSDLVKGSSIGGLLAGAFTWGKAVAGSVATVVLMVIAGIYIAINPGIYRRGLVMLFPKRVQPQIADTLSDAGAALRLWLGAQLLAMIMVGVMIGAGLAFIGVPSALGLGFVAGVLEFIPYLGPILSAVPALLIASTQSWEMVGWTLLLFIVVQQVENNVILPLVTGRAVDLPPAVGLLAVVAIGILFGPLGLLLAYPLAIVIDVAVRRLYVREMLGEKVAIAGEKAKRA